jgi:putative DNA primase/helicase
MRGQAKALKIWQQTQPRRHLYLARKGFPQLQAATISVMELASIMKIPKPLEHLKGTSWLLVVPMRNVANKLQSLEFITGDGEKCFLPGGKLNGSACWMGKEGPVVVCEGVGTGLSLRRSAARQKLAIRVACAGSALNMKSLREVANYVMADNDESKTGEKVAIDLGKPYALPATVGMDFNDLEVSDPSEAALLLSQLLSVSPSPVARPTR